MAQLGAWREALPASAGRLELLRQRATAALGAVAPKDLVAQRARARAHASLPPAQMRALQEALAASSALLAADVQRVRALQTETDAVQEQALA